MPIEAIPNAAVVAAVRSGSLETVQNTDAPLAISRTEIEIVGLTEGNVAVGFFSARHPSGIPEFSNRSATCRTARTPTRAGAGVSRAGPYAGVLRFLCLHTGYLIPGAYFSAA